MLEINEIKKFLIKNKTIAVFSHYTSGNLYYTVELEDGIYQFPISTIDIFEPDENMFYENGDPSQDEITKLSADLGTTSFYKEMKGSELNRWIGKAVTNNEFIKIQ